MSERTALMAFNLAYRYGNIPLARMAEAALSRAGCPHEGFAALVEDHWGHIPAAHEGWATYPDSPGGQE